MTPTITISVKLAKAIINGFRRCSYCKAHARHVEPVAKKFLCMRHSAAYKTLEKMPRLWVLDELEEALEQVLMGEREPNITQRPPCACGSIATFDRYVTEGENRGRFELLCESCLRAMLLPQASCAEAAE